jgi:hypothetical protein
MNIALEIVYLNELYIRLAILNLMTLGERK